MTIKDLKTLKKIFKTKIKFPIFGAGVYPFHRLGPESFVKDYRILALRRSLDSELIRRDIKIKSIEKSLGKKHIKQPRNATTVLDHSKIKKYLSKFKNVNILVYKRSKKMERVCNKNNWNLIAPPTRFGKDLFENKIKFRKILEELNIPRVPGKTTEAKKLHYGHLINSYGLPFVIQHPKKGGGKGTFFINNKDDFDQAYKKIKEPIKQTYLGEKKEKPASSVIVAKFIKGPSPSITGCVTKHGVLFTNLQHQILDIPQLYSPDKGSGLFCGHDWSFSRFSKEIEGQAYQMTKKIGNYFKKQGYKGIFGLDFIMDKSAKKLYVIEANPRLLGSFPVLPMVQLKNNEPPILGFHILEYLDIDYDIDIKNVNKLMQKDKKGAQMLLHNLNGKWSKITKNVRTGVYKLNKNGELKFLRPGYKLKHLKSKEEFLVTEGVLTKGSHLSPNRRLCRIITLNQVLEDYQKLNPWAQEITKKVYKTFGLKPIKFIKFKKIFTPNFLAKG